MTTRRQNLSRQQTEIVMQPRRSLLFMPATNTRAMDKARKLPADCVVFDLEDAVDSKDAVGARDNIRAAFDEGGYSPRECLVRINHPDTSAFEDDMAAFRSCAADGVVIPKVESADHVNVVRQRLPSEKTHVWVMIETPIGVRDVDKICLSLRHGDGVIMGTQDLAQQLRVPTDTGLTYALSRCVMAARACGLSVIDGVYPEFEDTVGFAAHCERARELGFDGKSAIHPGQLALCNEHFGPTAKEVSDAQDLVSVWRESNMGDAGVMSYKGRMVEALHVRAAQRLLDYNDALIARFSESSPD